MAVIVSVSAIAVGEIYPKYLIFATAVIPWYIVEIFYLYNGKEARNNRIEVGLVGVTGMIWLYIATLIVKENQPLFFGIILLAIHIVITICIALACHLLQQKS